MIEPVHCGSNSILKVHFFGTPCIYSDILCTFSSKVASLLPTATKSPLISPISLFNLSMAPSRCNVRPARRASAPKRTPCRAQKTRLSCSTILCSDEQPQSCLKLFSKSSQSCPQVLSKLSQIYLKVVSKFFPNRLKVVPLQPSCAVLNHHPLIPQKPPGNSMGESRKPFLLRLTFSNALIGM